MSHPPGFRPPGATIPWSTVTWQENPGAKLEKLNGGGGGSRTRVRNGSPERAYVRIRPMDLDAAARTGAAARHPAWWISGLGLRRRPAPQPAKMTLPGGPQARHRSAAAWESGSVGKLLIGSFGFPIVLRELGTRHASLRRSHPVEAVTPPPLADGRSGGTPLITG